LPNFIIHTHSLSLLIIHYHLRLFPPLWHTIAWIGRAESAIWRHSNPNGFPKLAEKQEGQEGQKLG
jgi:hypothetical protein